MDLQSDRFGLNQKHLSAFSERFKVISSQDPSFLDICSLRNGILRYESETLLPAYTDGSKPRVLLVLGNPAIHSVKNGMFFYSKINGDRHGFWGKLATAGLVKSVCEKTRKEEANIRRKMILRGTCSDKYLIGLTTFYSFPTPAADQLGFSGVAGVESLFAPVLKKLHCMESQRILSYPFADGAIIVFTQKSSLKRFYGMTAIKPVYWPIRGKGSGGKELGKLISEAKAVDLQVNRLLN